MSGGYQCRPTDPACGCGAVHPVVGEIEQDDAFEKWMRGAWG